MMNNQEITFLFMEEIKSLVDESSTEGYALIVFNKLKRTNLKRFPFLKYITFNEGIEIDPKINSIRPVSVKEFLIFLFEQIGINLFRYMLKQKMTNEKLIDELKKFGINI